MQNCPEKNKFNIFLGIFGFDNIDSLQERVCCTRLKVEKMGSRAAVEAFCKRKDSEAFYSLLPFLSFRISLQHFFYFFKLT